MGRGRGPRDRCPHRGGDGCGPDAPGLADGGDGGRWRGRGRAGAGGAGAHPRPRSSTRASRSTRPSRTARPRASCSASAEGADLLVLGTHGYGAVESALLGSVSRQVVTHAVCPTVLVPQDAGDLRRFVVGVDGSEESLHALRWATDLARDVGADSRS